MHHPFQFYIIHGIGRNTDPLFVRIDCECEIGNARWKNTEKRAKVWANEVDQARLCTAFKTSFWLCVVDVTTNSHGITIVVKISIVSEMSHIKTVACAYCTHTHTYTLASKKCTGSINVRPTFLSYSAMHFVYHNYDYLFFSILFKYEIHFYSVYRKKTTRQ